MLSRNNFMTFQDFLKNTSFSDLEITAFSFWAIWTNRKISSLTIVKIKFKKHKILILMQI